MRQDDAERFRIGLIVRTGTLNQRRQLERGLPECSIFEEQPRDEVREIRLGVPRHFGGVEIEIHHAAENARILPVVVFVAGRHEGELSLAVPQRRPGQALDERFAVAPNPLLANHKQMERPAEVAFQLFASGRLNDLRRHSLPHDGAALHDIG